MSEVVQRFPDNVWFDGQVASWEGEQHGHRALFEFIINAACFREVCNSAGDPEVIELFQPGPGDTVSLIFIDQEDKPRDIPPVVLSQENSVTSIPKGSRFIMDATGSSGSLAYICTIVGEQPLT